MKLDVKIGLAGAFVLMVLGCSQEKNKFINRTYHRMTTHYNYYFNANEKFKSGVGSIESAYKEDYSELLPLFIYGDEQAAQSVYPEMEKVIEKCSNAIHKHSMRIKRKEQNNWIDECYLLIGKAYFYKKQYFDAKENFQYVYRAYKHDPSHMKGMLWLIKTRMEEKDMVKAGELIEKMEEDGVPEELKGDFYAVYADYLIREKDWEEAKKYLERAISHTKDRKKLRRYVYVLAQLYQKDRDYKRATEYYTQVIKLRPEYEMEFHARIYRAQAYDIRNGSDKVKKELNRMLRDDKNVDYYDQIYFALAELAFREGHEDLGISYLRKSASSSTSNVKQKTKSYLKLATYYYNRSDYVNAQMFYDSTAAVIPKEYEYYDEVIERSQALNELVEQIHIIQQEDSLQNLVNDPKERSRVIKDLIAQEVQRQKEEEAQQSSNGSLDYQNNSNQNAPDNGLSSKGEWYFDNPATMSFGVSDFKRRWGDRVLEDDWRRKNKSTKLASSNSEDEEMAKDSIKSVKLTEAYYLKGLPLTDSAMAASQGKRMDALFKLGNIYKERFRAFEDAVITFEKLVQDYDTSSYILPSYYQLYRCNLNLQNDERSAYYRKLIIDEFPFSEYAEIILDPAHARETRENRKRVDNYYLRVHDLYKEGKYDLVIIRCEKSKSIFPENHIQAKYDLLHALAVGHVKSKDEFKAALEEVASTYKEEPEGKRAQEILGRLKGLQVNDTPSPFKAKPEAKHKFVLLVPAEDRNMNRYKIEASNFNSKNFGSKPYKVSAMFLNPQYQLLVVAGLTDKKAALNYYSAFNSNNMQLAYTNKQKYQSFVITEDNFAAFYKMKDIEAYMTFFKSTYLGD